MPLRRSPGILLTFALLVMPVTEHRAGAHPHAWIDLKSTLILNDAGEVVALNQHWLFGDFYSSFVISDIQSAGLDIREGLMETARNNLLELEGYDYFTKMTSDGEALAFQPVSTFETGALNGRIYLDFTVTLTQPVDPLSSTVRYAVFDPTYYIEILYAEGAKPEIEGAEKLGCAIDLTTPEPTFEQLAFAASLDQTQSVGDGLGEVFAQWATVNCI